MDLDDGAFEEKAATSEVRKTILKMLRCRPNGLKEDTILRALAVEQDRQEAWGPSWDWLGVDLLGDMVEEGVLKWNEGDFPLDKPLTYRLVPQTSRQ
jgi:hypothetical protein